MSAEWDGVMQTKKNFSIFNFTIIHLLWLHAPCPGYSRQVLPGEVLWVLSISMSSILILLITGNESSSILRAKIKIFPCDTTDECCYVLLKIVQCNVHTYNIKSIHVKIEAPYSGNTPAHCLHSPYLGHLCQHAAAATECNADGGLHQVFSYATFFSIILISCRYPISWIRI